MLGWCIKDCRELNEKYIMILKEFRINVAVTLTSQNKPKISGRPASLSQKQVK